MILSGGIGSVFFAQFDEPEHPFRRNIVLNNVSRRYHVSTVFPEKGDFFDDILFKFFIGAFGQQFLLVDGPPEGKFIAEP